MLTRFPEEQVDMLEEAGADLDRIVIGHFGWGSTIRDRAMHHRVAKRGVTLGIDVVGSPARSLEENAEIALDLIENGFSSNIILSHDGVAYSRGLLETFGSGWLSGDFTIVSRQLLPLLRQKGVDEITLNQVIMDNPRRVLTIDPVRYPNSVNTLLHKVEADPLAPYDYMRRLHVFDRN
jgi:phosphotriesterase-related protein